MSPSLSTARSTRTPLCQVPLRLPSSSRYGLAVLADDQRVPARDGRLVDLDVRAQAAPEAGHRAHHGHECVVCFQVAAGGGAPPSTAWRVVRGLNLMAPTVRGATPEADLRESSEDFLMC